MRHLTLEEIARLVDEAPEPGEALHLADCLHCRRELQAMREQTEELAQLADPEPSPRGWTALEARLEGEGLLRSRTAPPRAWSPALLRTAAALALLALGGAGGLALWRERAVAPRTPASLARVEVPAPAAEAPPAPVEEHPLETVAAPAADPAPVRLAAHAPARKEQVAAAPRAADAEEEARQLGELRREYLRGLAEYVELAGAGDADPIARLAALDGLVRASRSALERAPDDPAINGYYLAAMGQRDAMIRQLARNTEETWY